MQERFFSFVLRKTSLMRFYNCQDDVVVGTLTVRENLMFSANLRLPSSKSHKSKCRRVENTIKELGLTTCADTKVSTMLD
jgi:ATP-binding cassette, subfamily G (WHITE), member 2